MCTKEKGSEFEREKEFESLRGRGEEGVKEERERKRAFKRGSERNRVFERERRGEREQDSSDVDGM